MKPIAFVLFIICLALPAVAYAQEDSVSITWMNGTVNVQENHIVNGELQITLQCTGSPTMQVFIRATTGSNPVRYINVSSVQTSENQNQAFVNITESGGTFPYIRSIQRISAAPSPDAEVILSTVAISGVLGNPGSPHSSSIYADIVSDLSAAGGFTADIQSGPRNFGGDSTITRVLTTGGDILGHILAPAGSILLVNAAAGDIGGVKTVMIHAANGIQAVTANNITADIDSTVYNALRDVWYVNARSGDCAGTIKTHNLDSGASPNGIVIAGALDGDVTITNNCFKPITVHGPFMQGRTIKIGGRLDSGSSIHFDAVDLSGQIIINSTNTGALWSGSVVVGLVALSPVPYYNNLSSPLGGGAVGQAPFQLHGADSSPANGSNFAFSATDSFELRHYGPVSWASGSVPVVVDYKPASSPNYIPLPNASVTVSVGSTSRDVIVTVFDPIDFVGSFDFRIRPAAGVLKCQNVDGTPDVASYQFILHNVP